LQPERFRRIRHVLDRRQPDLRLVTEKVHKVHNLSAMLRNCDAVGVLHVHAVPPDDGLDFSDEISASASKWVRVHRHQTVAEAVGPLAADGFRVVAAHPAPDAIDYREVDFTRPTALLVGTELYGVSEDALELADERVRVPMVGMVRSLNVSVATALLLYEAFRQRDRAGFYDAPRLDPGERDRLLFEWAYPRVARICRRQGRPYPPLGADGRILDAGGEDPPDEG